MKSLLPLAVTALLALPCMAQTVTTLSADSIKITGPNDMGELIIQNHTQSIPGFLYNRNNGRTEFRKVLTKINDSVYLVGGDTLKTAGANYVSLSKAETITGTKVFAPLVTSSNLNGYGTVFTANFTPTGVNDRLFVTDFRKPTVVNPNNLPYTAYAARFRGTIRFDSLVYFPGGMLDALGVRTNIWSRINDTKGMIIYKPAGVPSGDLLRIQGSGTITTTGASLSSGTAFRDSITFTSGTQDFAQIRLLPAFIQQSGASGPTRGMYVAPYLSGVSDFRGVEVNVDAQNGYAFYTTGTAPSRFGGLVQYAGNYAGTFTDRTLVDKHYADSILGTAHVWTAASAADAVYRTGNVGIGGKASADAATKLSVYGTLLAKKVRVSANSTEWPDYVFAPGYALKPIVDVQDYIQTYQHLPGVPSAAEVTKNGTDVNEMQAVLLKKIEELTLYVIEQDKKIQEQDHLIKTLQQKATTAHKRKTAAVK